MDERKLFVEHVETAKFVLLYSEHLRVELLTLRKVLKTSLLI